MSQEARSVSREARSVSRDAHSVSGDTRSISREEPVRLTTGAPPPALVAFTPAGAALAARLQAALPASEVFAGGEPLAAVVGRLFREGRPLVIFAAAGVAVRLVAPHLVDKDQDPPVVAVDDAGRYAICLLGGHRGGGNELARRVAAALGAQPIITTASAVHGLPAVDLLGQALGWRLEASPQARKRAAAALIRGEPVGLYQDAGEPIEAHPQAWGHPGAAWPACITRYPSLEALAAAQPAAALVITDRAVPLRPEWVVYRPPTLAAGMGCVRGAPAAALAELLGQALAEAGLAAGSLFCLATLNAKGDEPGLRELAERLGVPLRLYSAAELTAVPGLPNPSEYVRQQVGTPGVAEPAALLASGGGQLVVAKRKSRWGTVAIARTRPTALPGG